MSTSTPPPAAEQSAPGYALLADMRYAPVWLPMNCLTCLMLCPQDASVSEHAIHLRPGAKTFTAYYECPRCGDTWTEDYRTVWLALDQLD